MPTENELRDKTTSKSDFRAFIDKTTEIVDGYLDRANPVLFPQIAQYCLHIGKAHYSLGDRVADSIDWFGKAADYQRRFIVEGRNHKLGGRGIVDNYLELYSAAFLAGKSDALIFEFEKCTYEEAGNPAGNIMLAEFVNLLRGRPVAADQSQVPELAGLNKDWTILLRVFAAASRKNAEALPSALEGYLITYWGRAAERWAKAALKSPQPEYCGKWSLFAASVCRLYGAVPPLSKKAAEYIPADLVNV